MAELVDAASLEAVIMDDIFADSGGRAGNRSTPTVFDFDEPDSGSNQPSAPPKPRNRAKSAKATSSSNSSAYSAGPSSTKKKPIMLISLAGCSALVLALMGFFAVSFFGKSGSNDALQLAEKYRDALTSARDVVASQAKQPDPKAIDAEVEKMRAVLIACVRSPSFGETQIKELRTQLDTQAELIRDVKRNCTLLPLAASRGTKVDQLPQMIDLIYKQLTYGLRQVPDNRERSTQFVIQAFDSFRTIDRRIADTLMKSEDLKLDSFGSALDHLDKQCITYGEAALDRVELTFEQKQIFECGEAFRRWGLSQLSQDGYDKQCQALGKEIDAGKSRFDQAMRATRLDNQTLSGIERLTKRMAEPTGLLFSSSNNTENKTSSTTASSDLTKNSAAPDPNGSGKVVNPNSASTNAPASVDNRNSLSDSKPPKPSEQNPFDATTESNIVSSNETSATKFVKPGPQSNFSSNTDVSSPAVKLDPNQAPVFPDAKFRMGNSLAIKAVTKRSKAELEQIAAQIGRQLKAPGVPDVQMRGSLVTISFSTFAGKPSDAIQHLGFGKVEICDSQSRTLYVNDYE